MSCLCNYICDIINFFICTVCSIRNENKQQNIFLNSSALNYLFQINFGLTKFRSNKELIVFIYTGLISYSE